MFLFFSFSWNFIVFVCTLCSLWISNPLLYDPYICFFLSCNQSLATIRSGFCTVTSQTHLHFNQYIIFLITWLKISVFGWFLAFSFSDIWSSPCYDHGTLVYVRVKGSSSTPGQSALVRPQNSVDCLLFFISLH